MRKLEIHSQIQVFLCYLDQRRKLNLNQFILILFLFLSSDPESCELETFSGGIDDLGLWGFFGGELFNRRNQKKKRKIMVMCNLFLAVICVNVE